MTSKTYTTGIIVSAALAITGVLWHQTRSPYVAGEDIAAVLADTLDLRQILVRQTAFTPTNIVPAYSFTEARYYYSEDEYGYGTWQWQEAIQTTSFTVTAFRAEESFRNAAIRLIESVVGPSFGSGRYFLDPRCPSAGSMDLSITPTWGTNAPYRLASAFPGTNILFNANLIDVDCSGITLRDRIVTGTNQYGYTPGGITATSTPLTAGSIYGGTQRYDTFTNRLTGVESWWTYAGISPISYLLEPVEVLLPGAPAAVHLSSEWVDRDSYDAGISPDKASATYDPTFIGRAIHVHRNPFITTNGLDAFRRVLTNMVRTVEFDPACWAAATTYSYSGTDPMVTTTSAAAATWPRTLFDYGVLTGSWTEINQVYFAGTTNLYSGPTTNVYTVSEFAASWADLALTPMSIASNYYSSGQVDRVRLYAVTEASTPAKWYPALWTYTDTEYLSLTNLHAYVGASLAANQLETYGYPITNCAIPDIAMPPGTPSTPLSWLLHTSATFSTNQVWNLIGDVSHPSSPPTFTLAASSHAKTDLLSPVQVLHASGTEFSPGTFDTYTYRDLTASWRYHTIRLSKLMLIVDWTITLKSSGGYTNAP